MPSTLYFNYLYTAIAAQTTTLTVSGEEQDAAPDGLGAVNETVVVNVSAAELNTLMDVNSQGATAGYGYPEVVLDWASVSSADAKWAAFMEVKGAGVTPVDFKDDVNADCPTLQKVFSTETFAFDTHASNVLLTIPPEAIQKVDYSSPIELKRGEGTVLSPTTMAGAGGILGASITAGTDESLNDTQQAAVRGLFLQALAAGKYRQSGAKAPNGSDLPAGASPGFDFEAGDIIKVYTVLSLTKTRSFIAATDDATVKGSAGMKFKVDGSDVVVDGIDDTVPSDVKTWTVEWQLKVSA
jgi:hypothetical protein